MKFIFSISLLIISGVLFFTIIRPLYSSVSDLRTEVSTYNIALDNSTELQKTRDQLVDTYKHIKPEDREKLEHFLPNTVNNIKFILEVERIANLHSMSIKDIKFDTSKQDTIKTTAAGTTTVISSNDPSGSLPYGTFPIQFTTQGTYSTFTSFLKDLEHNLRLVDVKSISFAVPTGSDKPGVGPDPSIYTYSLKVETYWLK
jgi:Tfp pilus assembly protein PilO